MNFLYTIAQTIRNDEVILPRTELSNSSFTTVLQIVFGLAGGIALLVMMLASIRYITSQGNPQAVSQAKNTIIYALVGLVICAAAFSIVTFVVNKVA